MTDPPADGPTWHATVDRFWSDTLGCPVALLHEPGVHLVPGGAAFAGYQAVYLLRLGPTCLAFAPPDLRDHVSERIGTATTEELFSRERASALARGAGVALGPSRHHYAVTVDVASSDDAVRELGPDDERQLDALREACGHDDWDEGGFGDRPALRFATTDGSVLVAAGNLTEWRGEFSDVGLVTHPAHRGRGYARALTRAMTRAALQTTDIVRYRALTTNAASLAIARREGFAPYSENIVVRLSA